MHKCILLREQHLILLNLGCFVIAVPATYQVTARPSQLVLSCHPLSCFGKLVHTDSLRRLQIPFANSDIGVSGVVLCKTTCENKVKRSCNSAEMDPLSIYTLFFNFVVLKKVTIMLLQTRLCKLAGISLESQSCLSVSDCNGYANTCKLLGKCVHWRWMRLV